MASILQHQVESKVNDLYFKMQRHAQIIMKLSVELDRVMKENEELRSMVNQDRRVIKKLYEGQKSTNNTNRRPINNNVNENNNSLDIDSDIRTSTGNTIMNEYNNYNEHESNEVMN